MNTDHLKFIVKKLTEEGKGILAVDESAKTCDKRLSDVGIDQTNEEQAKENRRKYREVLMGTPTIENYISGVILYDETFWQNTKLNVPFPNLLKSKGILTGIKVDTGTIDFQNSKGEKTFEKITNGLDGLDDRLKKYKNKEADFTKWRAVFSIDNEKNLPSDEIIEENAKIFSEYAKIVQKNDMVPIIEPEVLLTGDHTLIEAELVTTKVVGRILQKLSESKVYMPGIILKTSMVVSGDKSEEKPDAKSVAEATVRMLKRACPADLGAVVFLSGGQNPVEATEHLNAISKEEPLPWPLAFSFARAVQDPALKVWLGNDDNTDKARTEFLHRLELNHLADLAEYKPEYENFE